MCMHHHANSGTQHHACEHPLSTVLLQVEALEERAIAADTAAVQAEDVASGAMRQVGLHVVGVHVWSMSKPMYF